MNRTDRLLAIILELQDRKHLRAEDLAAIFEVSKRTIYRDIQALCEAGVPVVAMTGQGYSLPEGYFLPPVSFSPDEALLLILGIEVVFYQDKRRLWLVVTAVPPWGADQISLVSLGRRGD